MHSFINYIKDLPFWRFITVFVVVAIIISEILIVIQSYILHGEIHRDLLIVGFVTPAIDAFVVFFITGLVLIQLKDKEAKLVLSSRVFHESHDGIVITNAKKQIIDVNPAFCDISGYSQQEIIGLNPKILSSGKHDSKFYAAMWQEIDELGHWKGEVWNRNKDGDLYAELLTIFTLKDEKGDVINYVGVFSDITKSKKQQEELTLLAHYDMLTGLPNRTLFTDRFNQAISHSNRTQSQLAVCFLDLDNFKPINDNFGHGVGDQILVEVAKRIKACIREDDTVSRQGGDEFALLLSDIETYEQCIKTLKRIHYSLSQPFLIDNYYHSITTSTGITLYPSDNGDIDTLIRHADQAMYQSKLIGKNRYQLYSTEQDQQTIQKHHQLNEIRQALINNEFCLYYQPKVNMKTGVVFGVEALIRWVHPKKGLLLPLKFLPIIENTELEILIGNWVINQALNQLDQWKQTGIILETSVNISSHHLRSVSFFTNLEKSLANHPDVNSKNLQLEILESSELGDLGTINQITKKCRNELGINIALDDFGTGYSSLTHLRNLPANTIKIDKSFVIDMLDDPNDYAIINGVIGLANSFNREVIAEGVETTAHGLMLLVMGCYKAQGFCIALPMPINELSTWLNNYRPNPEWLIAGKKKSTVKINEQTSTQQLVQEYLKQDQ